MDQKQGTLATLAGSHVSPSWGSAEQAAASELLRLALAEDLGDRGDLDDRGDVTSNTLLPADLRGRAVFVARSPGVIAGLPILQLVFGALDASLAVNLLVTDGTALPAGTRLATVSGPMRAMLTGERIALNFLQRLSGVATQTRRYVDAVAGLPCRILDTRKTTPGWRCLEKYAVRCGGGSNHRLGLFDLVMIKDNHLGALHGQPDPIGYAVQITRSKLGGSIRIEVEVDSLSQLERALAAAPNLILLDNMPVPTLQQAVQRRNQLAPEIKLEASGGVNLTTVRSIAETGVDYISVGALTHSAVALDIAMDYE
jgi:nicotinate-nucleotide pyrophosphorylase (carboxylating)